MKENILQRTLSAIKSRWQQFNGKYPRLSWTILGLSASAILLFFAIVLFIFLTYRGTFGELPTYGELKNIQNSTASEVYSEDGMLLGKYYIENRVNADYDELSPFLINALVATEDARFFKHSGVDFRALMRVAFKTFLLQQDHAGGGSTISQQLAKNLFGRRGDGVLGLASTKIKEMFTARRLEKTYSKEELLKLYLNTVPFGDNIFGVKVASQRFFNTSPADLSIEDAATLIGMLKANSRYNPVRNPERATGRRNTVLTQMVKYEYLPASDLDSLQRLPIEVKLKTEGHNKGTATYFREHLRGELKNILKDIEGPNGKPYNVYKDGLKIYTTIQSDFQRMAEEAVKEHLQKLQKDFDKDKSLAGATDLINNIKKKSKRYARLKEAGRSEKEITTNFNTPTKMTVFSWNENGEEVRDMSPMDSIKYYLSVLNAGFMVMQPQTGKVQAWVGGINQKYFQYDHIKAKRQVGSTFKPFVYGEGLRQGYSPCDYLYNRLVTYTDYQDWTPRNSDGQYGGLYSMKGALSNSVNAATVEMIMRTSVDSVRLFAQQLGIKNDIPNVPSIALGTADLSLQEMVNAYATFANKGVRPTGYYLTKIENSRGEVIYEAEIPKAEEFPRILEEEDNAMLTNMLQAVVDSGTARRIRYVYEMDNDIAGKTGTTQDQSDGWFMGYTPTFVAGSWVGAEYPVVHWKSLGKGQGANTALPIWGIFAKKLYAHPNYSKLQRATFYPLTIEQEFEADCPKYLESEDMLPVAEEEGDVVDELTVNDVLKKIFKRDKNGDRVSVPEGQQGKPNKSRNQTNPRSKTKKETAKSRQIKERNAELERKRKRKEKRKKAFKKIFGNSQ